MPPNHPPQVSLYLYEMMISLDNSIPQKEAGRYGWAPLSPPNENERLTKRPFSLPANSPANFLSAI
jgi:hypothetical protein